MNEGILLASDIDFMIHGIFKVKVFGQEVWITDSHACILIVMAVMVIFAVIANRKLKHATEKPDTFQNIIELIVEKLDGMVDSTMGKWAPRFVNYISTIFIFILMSNISGLFGLRPPTADCSLHLLNLLHTIITIIRICHWIIHTRAPRGAQFVLRRPKRQHQRRAPNLRIRGVFTKYFVSLILLSG